MDRWQRRAFVFLLSLDTVAEYAGKLLEGEVTREIAARELAAASR